jgi:membrane peptidoglycan carboxypeptidase
MDKKRPPKPDGSTAKETVADAIRQDQPLDPHQQAIRYKAFKYTFSQRDLEEASDKQIDKKLKKSKDLEDNFQEHRRKMKVDARKKNDSWARVLPRSIAFFRRYCPRAGKWIFLTLGMLLVINYAPGPFQHIIEMVLTRAIYDTAPIKRLPENLESYAHSAKIVDMQGAIIKSYGRRRVTQQIPDKVKQALLACEDRYFLPHPQNPWYVNAFLIHAGVSWFNLAGAVKDTMQGQSRGGSTIVMQNAKKVLNNTERNLSHKIEEIIISYMMVSKFGKEQNLDFYINTVPVGANIYGFPAAANYYFRKELAELNSQQLVVIGSFIPNHYRQVALYEVVRGKDLADLSPALRFHLQAAIAKTNSALAHLRSLGEISEAAYRNWLLSDAESIRRIGFREFESPLYGKEEWASWNVIKEVCSRTYLINGREVSGTQLLLDEPGDVVIETGIDLNLVEKIKEVIVEFLDSNEYQQILRARNQENWQKDLELYRTRGRTPPYQDFAGFMDHLNQQINVGVVLINQQGEIVGYVGGKEFGQNNVTGDSGTNDKRRADHNVIIDLMNRQARIFPSSTVKPVIAYYAMVAANAELTSSYADQPLEFKYVENAGKQIWLPRNWYNYDEPGRGQNRYLGRKYSLLDAQVVSVNTIFARLYTNQLLRNAMLAGFDEIGLAYDREDAKYWPFGIGASSVPVQQWLGVYNAFLDGYYREPAFVKRIVVNGRTIYDSRTDAGRQPVPLFESRREREAEMYALYEICNKGTAANLRTQFRYGRNLVSGKTGTAPEGRSALFVSHFNPYRDRAAHSEHNLTMIVAVTTNSGGQKSVGTSGQGPTIIAGRIYDHLFRNELRQMLDRNIETAKRENPQFRNNHVFLANTNRYLEHLLNQKCGDRYIHENIIGVDGFEEAVQQILNNSNRIYAGRDDLFKHLVDYYCNQEKLIRITPGQ